MRKLIPALLIVAAFGACDSSSNTTTAGRMTGPQQPTTENPSDCLEVSHTPVRCDSGGTVRRQCETFTTARNSCENTYNVTVRYSAVQNGSMIEHLGCGFDGVNSYTYRYNNFHELRPGQAREARMCMRMHHGARILTEPKVCAPGSNCWGFISGCFDC